MKNKSILGAVALAFLASSSTLIAMDVEVKDDKGVNTVRRQVDVEERYALNPFNLIIGKSLLPTPSKAMTQYSLIIGFEGSPSDVSLFQVRSNKGILFNLSLGDLTSKETYLINTPEDEKKTGTSSWGPLVAGQKYRVAHGSGDTKLGQNNHSLLATKFPLNYVDPAWEYDIVVHHRSSTGGTRVKMIDMSTKKYVDLGSLPRWTGSFHEAVIPIDTSLMLALKEGK